MEYYASIYSRTRVRVELLRYATCVGQIKLIKFCLEDNYLVEYISRLRDVGSFYSGITDVTCKDRGEVLRLLFHSPLRGIKVAVANSAIKYGDLEFLQELGREGEFSIVHHVKYYSISTPNVGDCLPRREVEVVDVYGNSTYLLLKQQEMLGYITSALSWHYNYHLKEK